MKISKLFVMMFHVQKQKDVFKEIGDEYKLELLEAIPEDEQVSIYEQGEFFDLMSRGSCSVNSKIKRIQIAKYCGSILARRFG